MNEKELYLKELEALKAKLVDGYVDPKTEASILRRIEFIEYKLLP